MFSIFDFTSDNAAELWAILEPVVAKLHVNVESYYSSFYGLF